MLDRIISVQRQLMQIESVAEVALLQEPRREVGHEKAERGSKVESLADLLVHLLEADVSAVVRENSVVGHGVEHRACRSRISFLGRDIFGPISVVAWAAFGNDFVGFQFGSEEI